MIQKQILLIRKYGIKKYLQEKRRKLNYAINILRYHPNQNDKWNFLKDKYKGQRVFLIGNGPSLNKTPLYLLKNEKVMCFNRFHLMLEKVNWKPDFYTIVDNLVLDDLLNEFGKVLDNAEEVFIPSVHIQGDVFVPRVMKTEKVNWFKNYVVGSGFSTNLPNVYGGGTVIFEGFQILKHLGFSEIIMIGVDMNYQIHNSVKSIKENSTNIQSLSDDDPNHFDPRYFGKGKKYHQPEDHVIQNILNNLKSLSQITDQLNIKIINAGCDSKVDYFPRADYINILGLNESERFELFEESLQINSIYGSLEEFKSTAQEIKDKTIMELDINHNYFAKLEDGLPLIKKNVFTHVCFGPVKGELHFVSRNNTIPK